MERIVLEYGVLNETFVGIKLHQPMKSRCMCQGNHSQFGQIQTTNQLETRRSHLHVQVQDISLSPKTKQYVLKLDLILLRQI